MAKDLGKIVKKKKERERREKKRKTLNNNYNILLFWKNVRDGTLIVISDG